MGKTRDLFKKIRDTKGTNISCKYGLDKGQKWYGPNRSIKKILRRGGKNTQKNCTKKDLHDPDNHNGMITYYSQTSWKVKSGGFKKHHYEQS